MKKIKMSKDIVITNLIYCCFAILFLIFLIFFGILSIIKNGLTIKMIVLVTVGFIYSFILCFIMIKRIIWINKCSILIYKDKISVCCLKKEYRNKKRHILSLRYIYAPFTDGSHAYSYIYNIYNFEVSYNDILSCNFKKNLKLKNCTGNLNDLIIVTKIKKYIISSNQFSKKDLLFLLEMINSKISII